MKPREFKLNLALPEDKIVSLNLARLRRRIKESAPGYDPAAALRRAGLRRAAIRRKTGGFPGRDVK